ncbi:hypothetical protein [Xanthomonas arboricola]|uniref:hypothetical protein n=1 Tax=Xanthomonas arboricola TaxID=56448 RepID=UPI0015E37769|nr:hypothetical protein [Xanthomonas arboricola]
MLKINHLRVMAPTSGVDQKSIEELFRASLSEKDGKKEGALVLQFYADFARDARSGEYVHKKFQPDAKILEERLFELGRSEKHKGEAPGYEFWRA